MYEKPYRAYMILHLLREGEGFTHKSGYPLTHRIIETFDITCFSAFFRDGFVTCRRKDPLIRFPKISMNNSALTIYRRNCPPKKFGVFPLPATDMRADNFSRVGIDCLPYPYLVLLFADERPHFVTLNRERPFFFFGHFYLFFQRFIFFIAIAVKLTPGYAADADDAGERDFFQKHLIYKFFFFIRNSSLLRVFDEIFPTIFAHVSPFSVGGISVSHGVFGVAPRTGYVTHDFSPFFIFIHTTICITS